MPLLTLKLVIMTSAFLKGRGWDANNAFNYHVQRAINHTNQKLAVKAASILTAFSLGELELWEGGSDCSLSPGRRVVQQGHARQALLASLSPSKGEGSRSRPLTYSTTLFHASARVFWQVKAASSVAEHPSW